MLALVLTCLMIALARVIDISLDTIRTVAIIQGRGFFAALLGFGEALIYILVVARVLMSFAQAQHAWAYAVAYAGGFAAGTFVGVAIEQRLAFGRQMVTAITRQSPELTDMLRTRGYRVTEVAGQGRDGQVRVLFIQVPRRSVPLLTTSLRQLDPDCYYVVNDVRATSSGRHMHVRA
jgi:uncharacterized protein YebE (UPF0316 family)